MIKRILFVDDSPTQRALWRYSLSAKGVRIAEEGAAGAEPAVELLVAPSPRDALEILGRSAVDLLVTDVDMPEMSGWELIEQASARDPRLEAVVVSSQVRSGDAPAKGRPERVRVFSKEDRESALAWVLTKIDHA